MYSDKLIQFHSKDPVSLAPNPMRDEISEQVERYLASGGTITHLGVESGMPEFKIKMTRHEWVSNMRYNQWQRNLLRPDKRGKT